MRTREGCASVDDHERCALMLRAEYELKRAKSMCIQVGNAEQCVTSRRATYDMRSRSRFVQTYALTTKRAGRILPRTRGEECESPETRRELDARRGAR